MKRASKPQTWIYTKRALIIKGIVMCFVLGLGGAIMLAQVYSKNLASGRYPVLILILPLAPVLLVLYGLQKLWQHTTLELEHIETASTVDTKPGSLLRWASWLPSVLIFAAGS